MNASFQILFQKLTESSCLILGLMSGTSADGLNLALCRFNENYTEKFLEIIHFESVPYTLEFKNLILEHRSQKQVNLASLCRLHVQVAQMHAQIVNICLQKWQVSGKDILAIASHGQTIYHAPAHDFNSTLQLGDADHLAVATQCMVWSDFRQKHIAHGGEGAPLASYFDEEMCSSKEENRVLLNLGGIANFTWLDAKDKSKNFATDTGPANTLLDIFCEKYFEIDFDKNGDIARSGKLNTLLLNQLLSDTFFSKLFPKSTGQELFNEHYVAHYLKNFDDVLPEDVLCTLTHFTAKSVVDAFDKLPENNFEIYASGGGVYNSFLIACIEKYSAKKVHFLNDLNINSDAKEAALFALLAYNAMKGTPFIGPNGKSMHLGKLSFPL